MGELIFKKMEIGESFFWKKHAKLAHLRILAPKIFPGEGERRRRQGYKEVTTGKRNNLRVGE